jgi:hypothetical protein
VMGRGVSLRFRVFSRFSGQLCLLCGGLMSRTWRLSSPLRSRTEKMMLNVQIIIQSCNIYCLSEINLKWSKVNYHHTKKMES